MSETSELPLPKASAASNEGDAAPQAKTPNRLTKAGVAILEEYWSTSSQDFPSVADRKGLTARIKKLPGCEYFTTVHTTGWFKRRMPKKGEQAVVQVDQRFPSLTQDCLQHLVTLIRDHPNPPQEVIETWATLLKSHGATQSDVVAWINFVQELVLQQTTHVDNCSPTSALPTPPSTATPEPNPHSNSIVVQKTEDGAMKSDPTQSPVLPQASPTSMQLISPLIKPTNSLQLSQQPSPLSPLSLSFPLPDAPSTPKDEACFDPGIQAIYEAFLEDITGCGPPLFPGAPPSTIDAFDTICCPLDAKGLEILHAIDGL